MELDHLKAAWQQQMQQELGSSKHTSQELNSRFQAIEKHITKNKQQDQFWTIIILIGMGICLIGFGFFRLSYTPEKFPHISIALYDAGFLTGMVFLSLKVLLNYWYTHRFSRLQAELYSATVKASLHGMRKNFAFIYRLSILLCLLLLPPILFLQIKVLSPVLGWQLHQQLWQTILVSLITTLLVILVGHAAYRYLFNREMRNLSCLLADLEELAV